MNDFPLGDGRFLANVTVHAFGTHAGQWGAHKAPCGAESDAMAVSTNPADVTCGRCKTQLKQPASTQDEIPVLYQAGQTIHMHGQPADVLGTVIAVAPMRSNGDPVYETVIYGGDFHRRECPHYFRLSQRHIEAVDEPPREGA